MAGAWLELNDQDKAVKYYKKALKYSEDDYFSYTQLISLFHKLGKEGKADKYRNRLFELEPASSSILSDIVYLYAGAQNFKESLALFFDKYEHKYRAENDVLGNLYFHRAKFLWSEGDRKAAKKYFLRSKEAYIKAFSPDDPVFGLIEQNIEELDSLG
jgi:tetratricopeptide (TPR) repeat protein